MLVLASYLFRFCWFTFFFHLIICHFFFPLLISNLSDYFLVSFVRGHVGQRSLLAWAFVQEWRYEDIHSCKIKTHLHLCVGLPNMKNAVCTAMLSGWPRDRLVITCVSLYGLYYRASGKSPLLSTPCLCPYVLVNKYVYLLWSTTLICST